MQHFGMVCGAPKSWKPEHSVKKSPTRGGDRAERGIRWRWGWQKAPQRAQISLLLSPPLKAPSKDQRRGALGGTPPKAVGSTHSKQRIKPTPFRRNRATSGGGGAFKGAFPSPSHRETTRNQRPRRAPPPSGGRGPPGAREGKRGTHCIPPSPSSPRTRSSRSRRLRDTKRLRNGETERFGIIIWGSGWEGGERGGSPAFM